MVSPATCLRAYSCTSLTLIITDLILSKIKEITIEYYLFTNLSSWKSWGNIYVRRVRIALVLHAL